MEYDIYLNNNNKESLEKLEQLGFVVCPCCKFYGARWIHFYLRTLNVKEPVKEFHGVGYECEEQCGTDCVRCSVMQSLQKRNVIIFNNVEDMVRFIDSCLCG